MWNAPTTERLSRLPQLLDTDHLQPREKLVHLHFFLGGSDWYAVEFDGEDLFFGYVILDGDLWNAEWGYFRLSELNSLKVSGFYEVDYEHEGCWIVRPACKVDKICRAQGWLLAV